jgi:hypothetical protein
MPPCHGLARVVKSSGRCFPRTASDQVNGDESLANIALRYRLTFALKNDVVTFLDHAVNEKCHSTTRRRSRHRSPRSHRAI